MPWKNTKLVYFGVPMRRRNLYVATLAFAIVSVATISWAVLAAGGDFARARKLEFLAAALATLIPALNGWRLIMVREATLYWEEARVIWPGSLVLLPLATWIACAVAHSTLQRGRLDYILPLSFGGIFLIFLLTRCATLGRSEKRSLIVRGDSGRRHSRPGLPTTPSPREKIAGPPEEEENEEPEPPAGDSDS